MSDHRDADEAANFVWLAAHQVLLRIGWIFKTESVVVPAFMDFIGGGPVLRGCLMVLNRIGFSVPPVLAARRLAEAPQKKRYTALASLAMAAPFAALSGLWFTGAWRTVNGSPAAWMPYAFLALYGGFFCATGLNQLASNALQGKLVRPNLRGRLFTAGVLVGSPLAIAVAAGLLPQWLAREDGGFGWIFAVSAVAFVLASCVATRVREVRDAAVPREAGSLIGSFRAAWQMLRADDNRRRLALVALLFSATFMLFPHYQSLARTDATQDLGKLMGWVCAQNAATAAFSLVIGPLADRLGNRAALRLSVAGAALAPLTALGLGFVARAAAADWFWLMFVPLGFTPVTIRVLINYALEIAAPAEHPQIVSALGVCLALPVIVGSPLAGVGIAAFGYVPLLTAGLLALATAAFLTVGLQEPRQVVEMPAPAA